MTDVDVFTAVAVLRELGLFADWIPMCTRSRVLRWESFCEVCLAFTLGFRLLSRDAVCEAHICDCTAETGSVVIIAASLDERCRQWRGGVQVPRAPAWPGGRMVVRAFMAELEFTSANSLCCRFVCCADPRMPLPEPLLMLFLKVRATYYC